MPFQEVSCYSNALYARNYLLLLFPSIIIIVITSLTKTPNDSIVATDTRVTFNCQANGIDTAWFVDEVRRDSSFSDYEIISDFDSTTYDWNITLTTNAGIEKNGTVVLCYSIGTIAGQVAIETLNIIVAGEILYVYLYSSTRGS